MNELVLRLKDGSALVVPATLDSLSTYVVLEQEDWFEKEISFFSGYLKPGMNVLDIGANIGVYAIQAARRVGPSGHVHAYEPGSEARNFLLRSVAENGLTNITVSASAVSDRNGESRLIFGFSSELNQIGKDGAGEAVRLVSLDDEDQAIVWPLFDVIKLDAEGEELRILNGAARFLERHAPLIMFEVRHSGVFASDLIAAFRARGFGIYRSLVGAPLLVPVAESDPIDGGELNLFAANPARAARLRDEGYLIAAPTPYTAPGNAKAEVLARFRAQPYEVVFPWVRDCDAAYAEALAAFSLWQDISIAASTRYGAGLFSARRLQQICASRPTLPRLSTLMRVSWELGWREITVAAGAQFLDVMRRDQTIAEPFVPALAGYDVTCPTASPTNWLIAAAVEQLDRNARYSSFFGPSGVDLAWLEKQEFVSAEMLRRRFLVGLKTGQLRQMPERLTRQAPDHVNAEIWRRRLIPGTTN